MMTRNVNGRQNKPGLGSVATDEEMDEGPAQKVRTGRELEDPGEGASADGAIQKGGGSMSAKNTQSHGEREATASNVQSGG